MSHTIVMSLALIVVIQTSPEPPTRSDAGPEMPILLRPTPVRLDFNNQTLAEIITQINTQSSIAVMLPPDPVELVPADPARPLPTPRQFSLHEPTAVPFWEAIDRVCRTVQCWPGIAVVHDPSAPQLGMAQSPVEPAPKVVLVPASGDRGFVSTDGLFRAVVARVSYGRDIRFAPMLFTQAANDNGNQGRPADETFFSADLIIMVEPRLRIQRLGDLRIHEATDDRGRSLIVAGPGGQPVKDRHGLIPPDGAAITVPVPLRYQDDQGQAIKRLRGSMTVAVSARKPGSQPIVTEVTFDFAGVPLP